MKLDGELRTQAKEFVLRARKDNAWATFQINNYMQAQKDRAERKEISESTLPGFYKPTKLLLEENDIALNWKKISRRIPKGRSYANDRAPELEEIKAVLSYPDRRIKPVALIMISSGCRLGSFDYLNWGNIEPIERRGKIISAKVKIYAGTNDEYTSARAF